ncbi:methyl-accepting chemotaxis protein [Novosphingobium sp. RD2P27]|uniref:Methyl-accepting chemotaxis protein n=1 Tax=Novosphingobium kalidii TaxID=3230299 RepID=A0ABV2CX51_9SPHN
MFFRNLHIAQKVMAGLALLALLSVFVAGFGAFQLSTMAERSGELIGKEAKSMKLAAQANENKSRMHQIWYATAIENDLPDFRNQLEQIAAERREFNQRLEALRPFMTGEDAQLFAALEQGLSDYFAATDKVPALWIAGRREEAEDVIQHPAREAFEKIDEALAAIVASQDQALEAGAAAAEAQSATGFWTLVLVSLIGLVSICGAVVWMVRREVTGPIISMTSLMNRLAEGDHTMDVPNTERSEEIGDMARAVLVFRDNARSQSAAQNEKARAEAEQKLVVDTLAQGLRSLAQGDLSHEITAEFTGSYAEVKTSFNDALAALRSLIGSVIASSSSLRAGSHEIAQAAEDLARRTESNAASIEETTAALTQIDGRIKATAEAAGRTVARADDAISTVGGGRSIADEAVQAMGRVRESAKGIDEVIEGVDKIAFQTRVLAMNAAVEAGRAGDAGRGFAVVADLVSALAMRAEEEAKRARDQLTLTQTDIVTAVGAVQSINGALTDISDGVGEVHALLGTMALDNHAQASAIAEISAAMNSMDQSTQQNAAMVEETSAAARNLSSEVLALSEQAGRFRIDRESKARGSRSGEIANAASYLPTLGSAAAWAPA